MTNQLLEKLAQVKAQIIEAFCQKQEMYFEYWADNEDQQIACFGDVLFFNFSEIEYDLRTNQPKGLIVQYCYDSLEANQDLEHEKRIFINYQSYCMGARYDLPKKEVGTLVKVPLCEATNTAKVSLKMKDGCINYEQGDE